MYTKSLFLWCGVVLLGACSKPSPTKTISGKYELTGAVKTLEIKSYLPQNDSLQTQMEKRKKSGTEQHCIIHFSPSGNQTEVTLFDKRGKDKVHFKILYNKDQQISEKRLFDKTDSLEGRYVFKYDGKELLTKQFFEGEKDLYSNWDYTYDAQGRKIEIESYGPAGDLDYKRTFTYNKAEHSGTDKWYNGNAEDPQDVKKFTYDEQGRKTEEEYRNLSDHYTVKIKYSYNDHDLLASKKVFDASGELQHEKTYNYNYDDTGNWVERIETEKGIPIFITERKITY